MTEPTIVAQELSSLFKELFPGNDLQEFHRFWDKTFQLMEDERFFDQEAIKERTRLLIDASINLTQQTDAANDLNNRSFAQNMVLLNRSTSCRVLLV